MDEGFYWIQRDGRDPEIAEIRNVNYGDPEVDGDYIERCGIEDSIRIQDSDIKVKFGPRIEVPDMFKE